ncbi:uncharacterized protein LOC109825873 [Asparagus officinalis]|uniref:uncharacterized protein LOC109825873 n=1 Tax=Asparagus officinalis TaxID=4686 RepID=UPI00098DF67D|nr:uncharacterized protein LOC109825873 [Asparagus officinalis]
MSLEPCETKNAVNIVDCRKRTDERALEKEEEDYFNEEAMKKTLLLLILRTMELENKNSKEKAQVAYERRKQLAKLRLKAGKVADEKLGSQLDVLAPLKY